MIKLSDLDRAFSDIWKHEAQIPTLLEKWQEMVNEYLQQGGHNQANLAAFENLMEQWNSVLEKNREILLDHQEVLKKDLKKGELKVTPETLNKRFRTDN